MIRGKQRQAEAAPAGHPAEIYAQDRQGPLYSPFHLHHDPMERLLLLNFDDDPDEIYLGFEPQVFDDDVHGQGLLVIGWRVDGYVDVYHQPGLRLKAATYSIAGNGLAEMLMRPMDGSTFEVTAAGVDAHITFDDKLGRPVELRVKEHNTKTRRPFALLAPMGSAATNPEALPLLFLHDFYFVRRANSEVRLSVAGKVHTPSTLPIPLDGSRMYFLRYSDNPLIITWNPAFDGVLTPLTRIGSSEALLGGVRYDLTANHGQPELAQMRLEQRGHHVTVTFLPAFPNLVALRDGAAVSGSFRIAGGTGAGTVGGVYTVARHGEAVTVRVTPSDGWQPDERKWSLRLLYRVVPTFTNWPKTYTWTATLDLSDLTEVRMRASWQRTE
jgi:hypothetical protein